MDRERTKQAFARWAPDLTDPVVRDERVDRAILDTAAPQAGEAALDLATGTGYFALEVARRVAPGQVTGTGVSPEMLEFAKSAADEAGIPNVRFQETPSAGVPASLGSVDLVTCCYALHHFQDSDEILTPAVGALRPGGRLVMADYAGNDDPLRNRALVKLIQANYDPTYHWSYSRSEVRELLRRIGLQDVKIGWMPKLSYPGIYLAATLQSAKRDPRGLKRRMEGNLSPAEQEALLAWIGKEPGFEPERVMGVFVASGKKPAK